MVGHRVDDDLQTIRIAQWLARAEAFLLRACTTYAQVVNFYQQKNDA